MAKKRAVPVRTDKKLAAIAYFTTEEFLQLKQAAKKEERSVSYVIRRAVLKELEKPK